MVRGRSCCCDAMPLDFIYSFQGFVLSLLKSSSTFKRRRLCINKDLAIVSGLWRQERMCWTPRPGPCLSQGALWQYNEASGTVWQCFELAQEEWRHWLTQASWGERSVSVSSTVIWWCFTAERQIYEMPQNMLRHTHGVSRFLANNLIWPSLDRLIDTLSPKLASLNAVERAEGW